MAPLTLENKLEELSRHRNPVGAARRKVGRQPDGSPGSLFPGIPVPLAVRPPGDRQGADAGGACGREERAVPQDSGGLVVRQD